MPDPVETELYRSSPAPAARHPHAAGHRVAMRLPWAGAGGPEGWMMLLSAAAWVFLVATHADGGDGGTRGAGLHAAGLAAMVVAMMLPLTAGRVRQMARSTATPLGQRAAAAFVSSYLAVWMCAMFAIDAAWRLTISAAGLAVSTGIVIAAAVLWEVAPAKWRQWHQGPQGAEPHVHGSSTEGRTDTGGAGSGAAVGANCVVSCWAQMAACVAFAHSLPVMIAFFLFQLHGRYRRPLSPVVAAMGVLGVCLVSVAFRIAGHQHHPHV
ncbi:MAG TPA: DUF2182 domain-containing protein [Longimicrobium sp.]